jgi:hypothetical protein
MNINEYFMFLLIIIKLIVLKFDEKNYFCGGKFRILNIKDQYGKE